MVAVGKPVFARVTIDGTATDVVLLTSGCDNGQTIGDGKGRLWMLNAGTGAVIKNFKTADGTAGAAEAGLAHAAAYREPDGRVRYAYGGDLLGNLWRFDLTASGSTDIAAERIAILKDASNNLQPVTSVPELVPVAGKRVVLVGTGRLLDIGDFGSTRNQSIYAVVDGSELANARSTLVRRTYTRGASPELTGSTIDWATARGWYFDLPAGEQVNTDPSVSYGAIVFAANKSGSTDCSQQSWLYYADIATGQQTAGSTSASQLPMGVTIQPAKNAWRELRR